MLKHIKSMLIVFTFCLLFIGCTNNNKNIVINDKNNEPNKITEETPTNEKEYVSFVAKVMEINDSNYLVEPLENTNEAKSSDRISVGISNVKEIPNDIKVDDYIEIFYNGMILESYPAQINASEIKTTNNKFILIKQLEVIEMKEDGFIALGTEYGDENNQYYITLENIPMLEIKINDFIEIYYVEDTTITNDNKFRISPIDIKVLNYCPIDDPQEYKQMIYVENTLYVNTGYVFDFIKCGTLDGTIEDVIPFREIPCINGTANFEANGYQKINDDYILVPINNKWYCFAPNGHPVLNDCTIPYSMLIENNVISDVKETPIIPILSLNEINKTFTFRYDPLSSYLPYGTYKIEDNNIICVTNDNEKTFVFTFYDDINMIHFNEKESSKIEFIDKNISVNIRDGSVFFSNK